MTDHTFDCMGTHVRLLVGNGETADACRAFLEHFDATLSRFEPDSELSRLNAAPRTEVAASPLLRTAIAAGLVAAQLTGGLVDPTLTSALEAAGYDRSRRTPELPLSEALRLAPARRPAQPNPLEPWRQVRVGARTISRPPGIRLDTGGTGKGLAADLLAQRLDGRWAVDCGGDIRVSGAFDVHVKHPLTGETAHVLSVENGAIATSGLDVRLWHGPDGTPRHHLLDPSTRRLRLDRPRGRDGARTDRRRGRGAREGRAAQRPATGEPLVAPARRSDRPRRGRRRGLRAPTRGAAPGGGVNPQEHAFWLVSRSAGVVALVLVAASVLIGLTLAAGLGGPPARRRALVAFHEQTALGEPDRDRASRRRRCCADRFLRPGVDGLLIPFAIDYRPAFVAAGIVGGYLAALLGLSFYVRRRIGGRRWRNLHRATPLVYVLGLVHTLGAGTDAGSSWLRAFMLATAVPAAALLVARIRKQRTRRTAPTPKTANA